MEVIRMDDKSRIEVTVVVPIKEFTMNLDMTLRSILEQVYVNFEVILILHPQLKSEISNLENYLRFPNVKHFFQEKPGLYEGMNDGWIRAKDSYICFMGVGDFFLSNEVFLSVTSELKSYSPKSLAWGYGPWLFLDSLGGIIFPALDQSFDTSDLLKNTTPICHQTVFMSKSLLQRLGGFDISLRVASDRDLLDRAAQIAAPRVWSETITAYVDGGFSAINQTIGHKELECLQNLRKDVTYKKVGLLGNLRLKLENWRWKKSECLHHYEWLPIDILRFLND
jgi:glycosyltransferase involved in cell wall biosynthesis